MSKVKSRGFVRNWKWTVVFIAVFLLHFFIVQNKFLSWPEIFDGRMIMNFDYGLHYYDVVKGVEFLNEKGVLNGYDEAFFGGYQKGITDDLSSKFWILFAWVFSFLGVAAAYKLFIYLSLLLMPVIFALALKTTKMRREIILLGFVLAVFGQNVSKSGNFLWVGMITFPLALYLSVFALALLMRFFKDIDQSEAHRHLVLFTLCTALTFYVHVLAIILIMVPAGILYLLNFKKLRPHHQTGFWLGGITVFLASSLWLGPLITSSAPALGELKTRFFQIPSWQESLFETLSPWLHGSFHSLNLRFILLLCAAVALFVLFKKHRKAFWFHFLTLIFFAVVTYVPIPQLNAIQPYRFQVAVYTWSSYTILRTLNLYIRDYQSKKSLLLSQYGSIIIIVFLTLSFFVPPFRNAINNFRILSTEVQPALAASIDYFKNQKVEGRVLFEVEHSADAVLFHLETKLNMIGGPYRYAFWGNPEANFTEEKIFNQDINEVDEAEWQAMIKKYNITHAVCYSEKSCTGLQKQTVIWQPVQDFGGRKIFQLQKQD